MKLGKIFIFVLGISVILTGCKLASKDSTTLKITQNDEKIVLKYLDTKTNDIAYPIKGKMYSAFKLLGTDQDKLYIWLVKVEYFKVKDNITHEGGDAVSVPVVLYVKKNDKCIAIIGHKFPEDGEKWGKSVKRLFPPNIRFPNYDDKVKLEEVTKTRARGNRTESNRQSSEKEDLKVLFDSFYNKLDGAYAEGYGANLYQFYISTDKPGFIRILSTYPSEK